MNFNSKTHGYRMIVDLLSFHCRNNYPITKEASNKSKYHDIEREFYNELGGYRGKRSAGFYKNAKDLAIQMTKTLDKLVGPSYDSRIRPNYGGKPVLVELNMAVTGMVI